MSAKHVPADDVYWMTDALKNRLTAGYGQTPQLLPLNPTATWSPSTITGTRRRPSDNFSMWSRFSGFSSTSI